MFPVLCQPAHCVNSTGLVGFTQLFFMRAGRGSCVKPAGLGGYATGGCEVGVDKVGIQATGG